MNLKLRLRETRVTIDLNFMIITFFFKRMVSTFCCSKVLCAQPIKVFEKLQNQIRFKKLNSNFALLICFAIDILVSLFLSHANDFMNDIHSFTAYCLTEKE